MVRRLCVVLAIMALTMGVISGCEELRHTLRSTSADQASKNVPSGISPNESVGLDPSKIQAVDSDAKNPKSFFQNNRRSGGWSSEAREIEGHLGVGP